MSSKAPPPPTQTAAETRRLQKEIKKTQETLGKFIKTPCLTEKVLQRPPFRFLFDVIKSIVNETGFLKETFSEEELSSCNNTSGEYSSITEWRRAFLNKLIIGAMERTGESTDVKPSRILSGLEPEKTNQLLQILAKGIQMGKDEAAASSARANKVKSLETKSTKKDPPGKGMGVGGSGDGEKVRQGSSITKSRGAGQLNQKAKNSLANMKKRESSDTTNVGSKSVTSRKQLESRSDKNCLLTDEKDDSNDSGESKNPSSKLTQDNNTRTEATTPSAAQSIKSHGDDSQAAPPATSQKVSSPLLQKSRISTSSRTSSSAILNKSPPPPSSIAGCMKPPAEEISKKPQGLSSSILGPSKPAELLAQGKKENDNTNNHFQEEDDDDDIEDDDDGCGSSATDNLRQNGQKWISPSFRTNPVQLWPNSGEEPKRSSSVDEIQLTLTRKDTTASRDRKSDSVYIEMETDSGCRSSCETESDKAESVLDEVEEQSESINMEVDDNEEDPFDFKPSGTAADGNGSADGRRIRLNGSLWNSNTEYHHHQQTDSTKKIPSTDADDGEPDGNICMKRRAGAEDSGGNVDDDDDDDNWACPFRERPKTTTTTDSLAKRPVSTQLRNDDSFPSSTNTPTTIESHFFESVHDDYRPPEGLVSNIILDSGECGTASNSEDDEEEFQAKDHKEQRVSLPQGGRNNTLGLKMVYGVREDCSEDMTSPGSSLPPQDQRGYLVNQILSTQRELESFPEEKVETSSSWCPKKSKSYNERLAKQKEMERLKELVQQSAREAGPLAKLLDLCFHDVLLMEDEYLGWKEEGRKLELEVERLEIEKADGIRPLEAELEEIDKEILDRQRDISNSQLKIYQMERQLETRVELMETQLSTPIALPPPLQSMKRKFLISFGISLKDDDKLRPGEEEYEDDEVNVFELPEMEKMEAAKKKEDPVAPVVLEEDLEDDLGEFDLESFGLEDMIDPIALFGRTGSIES